MIDYRKLAYMAIRKYLNINITDDEIETLYSFVVDLIVQNIEQNQGKSNVQSERQGSRSISYFSSSSGCMTDEIKDLLPLPKVRMF